jgi:hypothetical protein
MRTELLRNLSLICLGGTVLWLVFLIAGVASTWPLETFEHVKQDGVEAYFEESKDSPRYV